MQAADDQEIETVLDEFIGKVTQPTIQCGPILAVEHFTESLSDESGRQLPIACCQGISHGFVTWPRFANQAAALRCSSATRSGLSSAAACWSSTSRNIW